MIVGISGLLLSEDGKPVGSAGSGKDTFADFLVQDSGFVKIALADPLKRICKEVYDFTDDQLWGPSEERNKPDLRYQRRPYETLSEAISADIDQEVLGFKDRGPQYLTPRYALQLLGTEWGRDCYPNTWVDLAVRNAKEVLQGATYNQKQGVHGVAHVPYRGVAIPDVRFKNEIAGLREHGAKLVRIKRVGKGLKAGAGVHQSERESVEIHDSQFDLVIDNSGTLEDLRAAAREFVRLP